MKFGKLWLPLQENLNYVAQVDFHDLEAVIAVDRYFSFTWSSFFRIMLMVRLDELGKNGQMAHIPELGQTFPKLL